jgi:hypothetical protein
MYMIDGYMLRCMHLSRGEALTDDWLCIVNCVWLTLHCQLRMIDFALSIAYDWLCIVNCVWLTLHCQLSLSGLSYACTVHYSNSVYVCVYIHIQTSEYIWDTGTRQRENYSCMIDYVRIVTTVSLRLSYVQYSNMCVCMYIYIYIYMIFKHVRKFEMHVPVEQRSPHAWLPWHHRLCLPDWERSSPVQQQCLGSECESYTCNTGLVKEYHPP